MRPNFPYLFWKGSPIEKSCVGLFTILVSPTCLDHLGAPTILLIRGFESLDFDLSGPLPEKYMCSNSRSFFFFSKKNSRVLPFSSSSRALWSSNKIACQPAWNRQKNLLVMKGVLNIWTEAGTFKLIDSLRRFFFFHSLQMQEDSLTLSWYNCLNQNREPCYLSLNSFYVFPYCLSSLGILLLRSGLGGNWFWCFKTSANGWSHWSCNRSTAGAALHNYWCEGRYCLCTTY